MFIILFIYLKINFCILRTDLDDNLILNPSHMMITWIQNFAFSKRKVTWHMVFQISKISSVIVVFSHLAQGQPRCKPNIYFTIFMNIVKHTYFYWIPTLNNEIHSECTTDACIQQLSNKRIKNLILLDYKYEIILIKQLY